ncbi:MAG: hypothetical protein HYZ75_06350 [Elusimicrobia bacterium]|nr:hypothetical protein [Elusimicrobiota bacterium]
MEPDDVPKPPEGPLPPERRVPPPPKKMGLVTLLRVCVLVLPLAALTALWSFTALSLSAGFLRYGQEWFAPLLFAAAAALFAWLTYRSALRTWRIHRGWEPAGGMGLLVNVGAVLAFLGLIGAVVVSKFGDMMRSPEESSSRGNLGSIRSALSIYYGDLEGVYPSDLSSLTVAGKYIGELPQAKTPKYHKASTRVTPGATPSDSGGWGYNNVTADPNYGNVFVNCTHTDLRSRVWASY